LSSYVTVLGWPRKLCACAPEPAIDNAARLFALLTARLAPKIAILGRRGPPRMLRTCGIGLGFVTAYSPHPLIALGLAHSKNRRQLEAGVGLAGRLIAKLPPRMNSPGSTVRVARHKLRGKPF